MKKKSKFLIYTTGLLFLIFSGVVIPASADELATSDGKRYEGIITNQSPSCVTLKLKDRTITVRRSDLKYIKKWGKEENEALKKKWQAPSEITEDSQARDKELKYAGSVRYSDKPWQIYEEDSFIAFHRNEDVVKSRLKDKVGDYCKKVADKLGYEEFKIYDKSESPDWDLKFKFYAYGNFGSWKKAAEAIKSNPATLMAFASGNRRVSFYEGYMKTDVIYHEITHDIYNELINNAKIPNWWSEGVAQYALLTSAEAREDISNSRFRALNNRYIPLSKSCSYEDKDSYKHNYEDGLSVVYFLVRDKGKDKFKEFNYNLRKGKSFEKSLFEVYDFDNINALDKAWVEYLKKIDVKDMVGE